MFPLLHLNNRDHGRPAGGSRDALPPMGPREPSAKPFSHSDKGTNPKTLRTYRPCEPADRQIRQISELAQKLFAPLRVPPWGRGSSGGPRKIGHFEPQNPPQKVESFIKMIRANSGGSARNQTACLALATNNNKGAAKRRPGGAPGIISKAPPLIPIGYFKFW